MKILPAIVFVITLGALLYALTGQEQATATSPGDFYTKAEIDQAYKTNMQIDIKLLERIETIEKKLKIVPPKDSLRIEKKTDEKTN